MDRNRSGVMNQSLASGFQAIPGGSWITLPILDCARVTVKPTRTLPPREGVSKAQHHQSGLRGHLCAEPVRRPRELLPTPEMQSSGTPQPFICVIPFAFIPRRASASRRISHRSNQPTRKDVMKLRLSSRRLTLWRSCCWRRARLPRSK